MKKNITIIALVATFSLLLILGLIELAHDHKVAGILLLFCAAIASLLTALIETFWIPELEHNNR